MRMRWMLGGMVLVALLGWVLSATTQDVESILRYTGETEPFTASLVEIAVDGDGQEVLRQERIIAQRSDGAVVEVREPVLGALGNRLIWDVASNERIAIDNLTGSTTTYGLSERTSRRGPVRDECMHTAETNIIRGVEVFRSADPRTLGLGETIDVESWVAPALGCLALSERRTVYEVDGSLRSTRTIELIQLELGEPRSDLFVVPDSYIERSPSQVMAELERRLPEFCGECNSGSLSGSDGAYFSSQIGR